MRDSFILMKSTCRVMSRLYKHKQEQEQEKEQEQELIDRRMQE